jgi:hypothetical protein
MDDIDSILDETILNVVSNDLSDFDINATDVGVALNRIIKAMDHGKEMGIFSEEDHEANELAVGTLGILIMKTYPEIIPVLKQHCGKRNE